MKVNIELALERIEQHFEKPVFAMLVKIIHWADVMDMIRNKQPMDLLNDTRVAGAMMAPFQGFGEPAVWSQLGTGITVMVIADTIEWMEKTEPESLASIMLLRLGPTLASITGDQQRRVTVARIIRDAMEK